ncbi:sensor histidine kinase [Amycolatopsis pigmentata]|uniref:histidine kinase n=1 Tax=Amycolatopsis pigmentata TaxID=450801 RepID=A0ABW5FL13_9PSEU
MSGIALSAPDEGRTARFGRRGSISAHIIGSLIAVIAALALVMAATITLLMAYVPNDIVGAVPGVSPDPTGSAVPPPAGVSGPMLLPRREGERLLVFSAIALAVVIIGGAVVVRWIVRRSLAPLSSMTDAVHQAAQTNLRARVPVGRVRNEVTDLAVSFNIMLARLDDAFEAQRRFAANASHELQTPLAVTQAVLDYALADAPEGLTRDILQDLRSLNSRSVQTVRTLLDLAETQGGEGLLEDIDLTLIVRQETESHQAAALKHDVTMCADLDPAVIEGNATLVRLMVRNLLDNAIRHNRRGGRVELGLRAEGHEYVLLVANTGAPMSADEVAKVVEPFHRGAGRLQRRGSGLGAALMAAVIARHGWQLRLDPGAEGGLIAEVRIPKRYRDIPGA